SPTLARRALEEARLPGGTRLAAGPGRSPPGGAARGPAGRTDPVRRPAAAFPAGGSAAAGRPARDGRPAPPAGSLAAAPPPPRRPAAGAARPAVRDQRASR